LPAERVHHVDAGGLTVSGNGNRIGRLPQALAIVPRRA
jgi:hypothetical protein